MNVVLYCCIGIGLIAGPILFARPYLFTFILVCDFMIWFYGMLDQLFGWLGFPGF